jgi:glycerol-3-phosphate dehydrogenase
VTGTDAEVAVVGGGVVGCATALALSRSDVSVALLEAEAGLALGASGTNSGILHTGFDSPPGDLETELILRAGELRDPVLDALRVPVARCGAVLTGAAPSDEATLASLAANAGENGVQVDLDGGTLRIPGESVTDPIAFTLALAGAAERHGAELRTGFRVVAIAPADGRLAVESAAGDVVRARVVVNCAGLHADEVARLVGDDSFEIYPRKGEFLVFEPGEQLDRILLPVPTKRTKGVLVFPTLDGKVVAGPTAVDQVDKRDWSVRAEARDEIVPKAVAIWPPLEDAEQIGEYAGLRPAGRGVNYAIGPSKACPGLVNVAAVRSTGLTASLGIAERVRGIVGDLGVALGPQRELEPAPVPPPVGAWWRRVREYRGA